MVFKNLVQHLDQSILVITINRPNKLNALNQATLNEIHISIRAALENNAVRGIIITGAGNTAFAAGADIGELAALQPKDASEVAQKNHTSVFNFIENASKPVIAAINGFALGGGLELALACHLRLASINAKMGLPELTLGLIPGYGGTQRLPQLIGKARALEIILTAEMIDANKALNYGLINHITQPEELINKAKAVLTTITKQSITAIEAAIRAVNASMENREFGFKTEIQEFAKCFGTPDYEEGVKAFLEKRKPRFKTSDDKK